MRKLLSAVLVACALASAPIAAADRLDQITVDATAGGVAFTAAKIDPSGQPQAVQATCHVRTAEISFTYDGTVPTSTVGQLLEPGDWFTLTGHDRLFRFRAIRTGATSGQLDCEYT